MIHTIVERLGTLAPEWITLIVAALPIAELRGAIPVGVYLRLSLPQAFFWSVVGNLLPVIPLLLFLDPVSSALRRFPLWAGFFEWLFARTAKNARLVQRYQAVGLAIFVAVPLPMTGAWTGCVAASLFKLPFLLALAAISCGVIAAGLIVSVLVYMGCLLF